MKAKEGYGLTFTAKPISADEVAILGNHLWEAMIHLPQHHHRTTDPSACGVCVARSRIVRAYRMLPRQDFQETVR
jgi:hypothetical protein